MKQAILVLSIVAIVVLSGCLESLEDCEAECDAKGPSFHCVQPDKDLDRWRCELKPEEESDSSDEDFSEEAELPEIEDADKDGLTDQDEITKYHTDPLDMDTDGDGLSDGSEVNTHKTDPLDEDTDNDGVKDGQEVTDGTDPGKASSTDAEEDSTDSSSSSECTPGYTDACTGSTVSNCNTPCSDSDGGNTPGARGAMCIYGSATGEADVCEDHETLREYKCSNNGAKVNSVDITCNPVPEGETGHACEDGKCRFGS